MLQILLLFLYLSSSGIPILSVTCFIVVPQFLDILSVLGAFFPNIFSLCISVLKVSIEVSSSSRFLFSVMSSLLMSPSVILFLSINSVFDLEHYFFIHS